MKMHFWDFYILQRKYLQIIPLLMEIHDNITIILGLIDAEHCTFKKVPCQNETSSIGGSGGGGGGAKWHRPWHLPYYVLHFYILKWLFPLTPPPQQIFFRFFYRLPPQRSAMWGPLTLSYNVNSPKKLGNLEKCQSQPNPPPPPPPATQQLFQGWQYAQFFMPEKNVPSPHHQEAGFITA